MTYEDQVIAAAKQGYGDVNANFSETLEILLRAVFKAGVLEGKRNANGFTGLDD